jgi:hypothetical protein
MAGQDSEQSIHVVLLPNPSQGHINPILQFGKRLAAHRGVRCTLAVTRFVLGQSGQPSPGAGGAVHIAAISDGCDRGGFGEAGGIEAYTARLESAGSETVGELLRSEAEQGRPVRALVYDAFLPWAQRVGRRHGAACAAFFTQPCAVDVAYGHAWAGRVEPPLVLGEEEPLDLPGLPAGLRPGDLPTFLTDPDDRGYLDLLVNQFGGLDTADHILVNSFYELQPQVRTPLHCQASQKPLVVDKTSRIRVRVLTELLLFTSQRNRTTWRLLGEPRRWVQRSRRRTSTTACRTTRPTASTSSHL